MTFSPKNHETMLPPSFSIIILCWNSNQYIPACLESLHNQTDKDFEILLVDNGSPVPVSKADFEQYPDLRIRFFQLNTNIGFAAGNNYASQYANGKFLVLLNVDAFPDPTWLENVRRGINKYPNSFFASKLIMANHPDKYDGKGDVYHISGLVWRKSHNTLIVNNSEKETEVFSACGAAAIYPREAFTRVNGFDPDYFSYLEDIDLGFRLRLIGYRCMYLPNAIVKHIGAGSSGVRSGFSVYYGHRNLVWTFFKDMPGPLLWLLLPIHMIANLFQVILYGIRGQGKIAFRAKRDAFKGLSAILEKRTEVQKTRSASIISIVKVLDWNPFSPLLKVGKK